MGSKQTNYWMLDFLINSNDTPKFINEILDKLKLDKEPPYELTPEDSLALLNYLLGIEIGVFLGDTQIG